MILITFEIFGFLNFLNYNGKEINYESIYEDFFLYLSLQEHKFYMLKCY